MGACPAPSLEMTGRRRCVGSGVMGSDGFESKKLGGTPGGAAPNRLGPAGNTDRDPAMDALSGLGDAAANLVQISGVIKWFDASKRYRFIVPDNGVPDVLLTVGVVRCEGYQSTHAGARLACDCLQRAKDNKASRTLSRGESPALHRAEMVGAAWCPWARCRHPQTSRAPS